MVAITISCPLELITKVREKAYSPSRIFQIGARAILDDKFTDMDKQLEEKTEKIHELEKKIARMSGTVAYANDLQKRIAIIDSEKGDMLIENRELKRQIASLQSTIKKMGEDNAVNGR